MTRTAKIPQPPMQARADVARVLAKRSVRRGVDAVSADVLRSGTEYLSRARVKVKVPA